MVRKHSKKDRNHNQIVQEVRSCGYSVFEAQDVGDGFSDIVVGAHGLNLLFEIKFPGEESSLTPAEIRFSLNWRGQYDVVSSTEEILTIVRKKISGRR